MRNYKLAQTYYQKVLKQEPKESVAHKASFYRNVYVTLMMGDVDDVLMLTDTSNDPYLITFKGYAHLKKLNWEEARTSFVYKWVLYHFTMVTDSYRYNNNNN